MYIRRRKVRHVQGRRILQKSGCRLAWQVEFQLVQDVPAVRQIAKLRDEWPNDV